VRTRSARLRLALALAVVAGGFVLVGGASALPQNNYAGPRSCADVEAEYGVDFVCTQDVNASQSSSGGINLYEAPATGGGGSASQTNTTGPNISKCILSATVNNDSTSQTDQSCTFTQSGDGGNEIVADIRATHTFSDFLGLQELTQDASITLTGSQTSTTGNNTVRGPAADSAALLQTTQSLTSNVNANVPPNQRQDRLILLDVDQVASSSGNNSVNFNLNSSQSADAQGISPIQAQDVRINGASDPNARAYVYQRTDTGTNTTKGRGTDSKFERSQTINSVSGGTATQRQWHTGGGFDIVADVDSAHNPAGGTVDFGTPPAEGTDCTAVDGFRKLGTIETLNAFGTPTTAGTRSQDDKLPISIPGTSPQTATVAGCSKLVAPSGTPQKATLSVDGHADGAITGAIAATLISGGTTSAYVPFNDQTVHVTIDCTRNTPNTCIRTNGGVTGSGTDVSAVEDVQFTGEVASFVNDNPSKPVESAQITWGDGTDPSSGTVSQSGGTGNVTGTHTYANPGTYSIETTLRYADNSVAASMNSTATVADVLEGQYLAAGSFAVSDAKAVANQSVTFWGDIWAAQNPFLSGKTAPSAFKGFENTINNPACVSGTWQTKTGNSPPPPAGSLPRYMYVIVASKVTAQKSTPTGDIVHIGVVDTLGNTYGPSPSQTGSGTFLGFVC
jgi:hypothetical protein